MRLLKPYTEQMSRNVEPSSWLDAHLGDGDAPVETVPGTINVSAQKRVPNLQITVEEARRLKRHRPNKDRRRRMLSEMVTDMSSELSPQ